MKVSIFLFSSFLSKLGDRILYFSLPLGFGLELKNYQVSAIFFIIPPFAMYLASLLKKHLTGRERSFLKDYPLILISLGLLELVIILCYHYTNTLSLKIFLVFLFIFLYAFAKEGLPRLLYDLSIYKYFTTAENYLKLATKNKALENISNVLGITISGYLIQQNIWYYSMYIDAFTFFIFAITIFLYGSYSFLNSYQNQSSSQAPSKKKQDIKPNNLLKFTQYIIPLQIGVSSIIYPYIPIFALKFNILNLSKSLYAMGTINSVVFILAFLISRKQTYFFKYKSFYTIYNFANYLFSTILFLVLPSLATMIYMLFSSFIFTTFYYPIDYNERQHLNESTFMQLNSQILKNSSTMQIVGSVCTLLVIESPNIQFLSVLAIFILSMISITVSKKNLIRVKHV